LKTYQVILTDPPWGYYGSTDGMGDVGKEYKTMSEQELLDYRYPLDKKGILFMWTTGPKLEFSLNCIRAHGLHYRGVAFVWVKTKKDGVTPVGAVGVRPSIVKPLAEFVISASYVEKGRPMPLHAENIGQFVLSPHVRFIGGRHSQKPDAVQERIERMYPDATKAEFFARRYRVGWDCFGDELGKLGNGGGTT